MKKIFLALVFILISVGIFAFPKYDVNNCEIKELGEIINFVNEKDLSNNNPNFGYDNIKVDIKNLFIEKTKVALPAKYDLRDYDYIAPVRDQNPYGTCWAHGSLASLESSALKKYGYDSISFSPLNMANKTLWPFSNLNDGGNVYKSMGYLSHLLGPVLEEDDPYVDPYISPKVTNPYGTCDKVEILDDQEYGLTDDEIDDIKKNVFEKNAVSITMYYDNGLYQTSSGQVGYNDYDNFFNSFIIGGYVYTNRMLSYYCNKEKNTINHCVTVVGWDDNYSKNNFKTSPKKDGAFLIRNSYGTKYHNQGYFWLSYYDKNLMQVVCYDFVSPKDKNYDKIYTPNDSCPIKTVNYNTFSINYDFQEDGFITGVQVYSLIGGVSYKIKITDDKDNVICTKSQEIPYAGYTTIMLDTPIEYNKKDKYICYINTNVNDVYGADQIPIEVGATFKQGTYYVKDHSEHYSIYDAQSSKWFAYKDANPAAGFLIKNRIAVTNVNLNKNELSLNIGDREKLTATVLPENATNKNVVWSSSDETIAKVDNNGNITALKSGNVNITVKTKDGGFEDTCSLTVVSVNVTLNKTTLSLNKTKTYKLIATVTGADDKRVTWTTSDKNIATVGATGIVTGIKAGKVIITATSVENKTKKATCSVTVK